MLFPYEKIRPIQQDLINAIEKAIQNKSHLIAHAPTGLGKTAASLPAALEYALKHKKTVFFLTSRHTQHKIAIETLQEIKKKHKIDFVVTDIIGKKHMCIQPGADSMSANEFTEYCKHVRENKTCEYYENTKESNKLTVKAKTSLTILEHKTPCATEKIIEHGRNDELCPYELSMELAKKAHVIIADYYYIFSPKIQETFFNKANITLENSIIIVDEAHNLPNRIRELLTTRLSSILIKRAISETVKYNFEEAQQSLVELQAILEQLQTQDDERMITRTEFKSKIRDYDQLIGDLEFIGDAVKEQQRSSAIGSIATFLESWLGEDEGFARILTKEPRRLTLSYRCLDPDLITKSIIEQSHSTILMSGTLTPTSMYKNILGFQDNTQEIVLSSPFPEENKLSIIVPQTTTKFTARGTPMYQKQAQIIATITNAVPGNSAVFFPSYFLRDEVYRFMQESKKTTFLEQPLMQKHEKEELLEKFKQYKKSGAVLLGVSAGNFSEGIDLPGDLLKCVIVVGLPLQRPDLETKELIKYYDQKFSKGWDYGYVFPAFNKCLQSAGRCIRSETDRGVIVFLDERFSWANYYKCFPKDLNIKISSLYEQKIHTFFN